MSSRCVSIYLLLGSWSHDFLASDRALLVTEDHKTRPYFLQNPGTRTRNTPLQRPDGRIMLRRDTGCMRSSMYASVVMISPRG